MIQDEEMCASELTKGNEKLPPHHQQVVALLISQGLTQAAAARLVGVHPGMVTKWKKNKVFADFLARAREKVIDAVELARDLLVEGAPLAAQTLLNLRESEDETIQLRASGNILDRAGVPKVARVEAEMTGEVTLVSVMTKAKKDDKGE